MKPDKDFQARMNERGEAWTKLGRQITGMVYGTIFLLILLWILVVLARAAW